MCEVYPIDRPDRRTSPQPYAECSEWDDENDDNWDGNDWGTIDGIMLRRPRTYNGRKNANVQRILDCPS